MLFNSIQFAVFFCVVTLLYFLLPHRFRWLLLLVASCYFYMAFVPIYILILAFTIVVDYVAGILIAQAQGRMRRWYLMASLVSNVGVLAFFKYFDFLNSNLTALLGWGSLANPIPNLAILLPIGLSFHTFQAMSYTIEVYRGHQLAERHFGIYALYVMFYPQLVAGPIERPQNLLQQFRERHEFDYTRITNGLRLMAWGFFKKVVVADRLAIVVDEVYNSPGDYPGTAVAIATFFFAYQIYCDFSGYSDIARGAARVMGFELMQNFSMPYFSSNIRDFWRRWHISLSSWFRDYLYFPLGGGRVNRARLCGNLLLVFTLSGLWHGANWTYVVWGGLHGVFVIVYSLMQTRSLPRESRSWSRARLGRLFGTFVTLSCVWLAWVFFRADNLSVALQCLGKIMAGMGEMTCSLLHGHLFDIGLDCSHGNLALMLSLIAFLEVMQFAQLRYDLKGRFEHAPLLCRWTGYYVLLASILFLGVFEKRQFIYFQF
jgi:alginate O-acetyltransferase complex protein AlgI